MLYAHYVCTPPHKFIDKSPACTGLQRAHKHYSIVGVPAFKICVCSADFGS